MIVIGAKFKVYKDKSIEIPILFDESEFDDFLEAIGSRQLYDFGPEFLKSATQVNNNASNN